tara:strand:+ start:282 stop:656 length:375 start_codon:yes stop_codon:yes gene_type:complete
MARSSSQLARLSKRFEAVPKAVKAAVEKAVEQCAEELVALAKTLAPEDRGDLKESIRVEAGEHDLARKIVAGDQDAFYARWVEFGTLDQPAQAFLFPAYRLLREKFKRRIDRAARKAIKEAWAR